MKTKTAKIIKEKLGVSLFFSAQVKSERGSCDILHFHDSLKGVTFVTSGLAILVGSEILMSCKEPEVSRCMDAISLLAHFSMEEFNHICRGLVVAQNDELPDIPGKSGFYLTDPIYFEALMSESGDAPFLWALPIFRSEVDFINEKGFSVFEEVLNMNEGIDLLSIDRVAAL